MFWQWCFASAQCQLFVKMLRRWGNDQEQTWIQRSHDWKSSSAIRLNSNFTSPNKEICQCSLSGEHTIPSYNFNSTNSMCHPSNAIFYCNNIPKTAISNWREVDSYSSVKSKPNRSKCISCFSQYQYPWNGLSYRISTISYQFQSRNPRICFKII